MLLSFIKKIKEHFKVNVGCFKILKQLVVYVCVLFYIFSQIVFCVHIHTYICRERELTFALPRVLRNHYYNCDKFNHSPLLMLYVSNKKKDFQKY